MYIHSIPNFNNKVHQSPCFFVLGRDHSEASRWYQRTVRAKDPFAKFTEESLNLDARFPRPGESGFSKSDTMLPPTTTPTLLDSFLNYDYNYDYPLVTPVASTKDGSKKSTTKATQSNQLAQKLDFVDPVQGDTFSVTFDPLPTQVYPTPPGGFLNFENTKLYPETNNNQQNVGLSDLDSNSLHNDLDFFSKLKNERKRILAERLVRNIQRPLSFQENNHINIDPLWVYLLASQ